MSPGEEPRRVSNLGFGFLPSCIRRLDLSSQRFEGLGPSGAEAVASALRTNTTLEELNVTSNSLGAHGGAGEGEGWG